LKYNKQHNIKNEFDQVTTNNYIMTAAMAVDTKRSNTVMLPRQ